jgi:acyl-CoA reductase-like NAD-dependent aldehyde dehydrogenase
MTTTIATRLGVAAVGSRAEIPQADADDANTAFGGEKSSGIGRFGGEWAIDEFTTDHWVSIQHEPRQYAI